MEDNVAFTSLTLSTYHNIGTGQFFIPPPCLCLCVCVCVRVCVPLCRDCALTLCAGTRLTNTVSSSSCDTVSPSQMMELIRSTMCMCTFWLWPLLEKTRRANKSQVTCLQRGSSAAEGNGSTDEEVCTGLIGISMNNIGMRVTSSMKVQC